MVVSEEHAKKYMEKRQALAQRLKRVREAQGLTRQKMAAKYKLCFSTLREYEDGKKIPDAYFLTLLSLEGCCLCWLLIGFGEISRGMQPFQGPCFKLPWQWVSAMSLKKQLYKEWFLWLLITCKACLDWWRLKRSANK
jgi:DNA-binding XRE family transcriptional regulator